MVNFVNYYKEKRIIGMRILLLAISALLLVSVNGYGQSTQSTTDTYGHQAFRDAVRLYDNSMFRS